MEYPIAIGRFDGTSPERRFPTAEKALRYANKELGKTEQINYYLKDRYGRKWPLPYDRLCAVCGQWDIGAGACNHRKIAARYVKGVGAIVESRPAPVGRKRRLRARLLLTGRDD